jgi:Fe-S-cluster-containing dehydrogenase component/DMSO reductase anchor subunit
MTTRFSLVEELIADQQSLTAVERFSRAHDEQAFAPSAHSYRDLIPLEAPRPGEQYAFEVELDKCSGCKACVTACHSLNGLDENETWRDVGLLVSAPSKPWKPVPAIQQTVTTACHHCVDPACLNGCPVLAYEKDPVTGIVRHLDDQCIGCQYCVLKCPYDVPKYNARLGIVRKCDMCSSRLAVGEAPACVQACPTEAIRITHVSKSEMTIQFRERGEGFLTGAPAGDYTLPTTRYVTPTFLSAGSETFESRGEPGGGQRDSKVSLPAGSKAGATLIAADSTALSPQPAHWPLVIMLVLSQASVGVAAVAALHRPAPRSLLAMSLALAMAGLGASIFHLGRPLGAWRAFLNLRRSWMSREIVVFGMFAPLLVGALALALGAPISKSASFTAILRAGLETGAPIVGLVGVFCSMMIYHDTRRPLWNWRRGLPLFLGTTLVLGAAAAGIFHHSNALLMTVIISTAAKLLVEVVTLRHGTDRSLTPLKKTALLVTGRFQLIAFVRLVCALLGGVGLPLLLLLNTLPSAQAAAALAFTLLLMGELIERFLFFTTVVAPKMPGGVAT